VPILADGVGTVVGTGSAALDVQWKGKRVILTPCRGWDSSSEGPDGPIIILGGTKFHPLGTLQEIVCVEAAEVELAPEHLNVHEAAALPLTGLTAWRAFFTKSGNALPEHNILITGIGGGVALNALQFAVAAGCNVYVTSGSEEKIARAREMGALAGVNYHEEGWENKLAGMLPNQRRWLDAIIDGAGGDIAVKTAKILKVSRDVDVA
jgi:NADPH:quinone reductase-like Zn-dependent oxidoreductase